MRTRNLIVNLARSNRLIFTTLRMSISSERVVLRDGPRLFASISDPKIFEFHWPNSGVRIDEQGLSHYPDVGKEEWDDGLDCPVPHPHIWLEADTEDASGKSRKFIWDIRRQSESTFEATPLVFHGQTLTYPGMSFKVHRHEVSEDGIRGGVEIEGLAPEYEKIYDIEEFFDHARLLVRFLRILCLPQTVNKIEEPNPKMNADRIKRKREPLATHTQIIIDPAAITVAYANGIVGTHASPNPHNRRAHVRRLPRGGVTQVRECVVGQKSPDTSPEPQDFRVRELSSSPNLR
ncbi:hypothetical protein ACCS54_18780 [Rhizobium johnstonii]|uniref:hypothetical protein n=1 Tax=Rhizobium johnstonii TaxID=3019933 RepID=UPI003F98B4F7